MRLDFPDGELERAIEVGAVDAWSVRVWLRCPGGDDVSVTLMVDGSAPVMQRVSTSAETDWTGAATLSLPDPAPDMPFRVCVDERELAGRLAPLPGTSAALTFGVGSCHMPFAQRDGVVRVSEHARAIYPAMRDEMGAADACLLLLLGDQIYADYLDGMSVRDDLTDDADEPPPFEVTLDTYRRLYRGFFNERGFRALREAFPTLCMWDDHDIFDNWGSTAVKTPLDRQLFAAACRAYGEYQHQRNPGGGIGAPPYGFAHMHGDIGFLVLDVRGVRSAEDGTMIGAQQWDWMLDWLHGDAAATVRTLFVVCSVPVAHVARWFTTATGWLPARFSGSVRDRWLGRAFVASRDAFLNALFDWEEAGERRQVLLLSGDVHCAGAYTIRRAGTHGSIRQLISSAMTTPLSPKQMAFNHVVPLLPNLLEPEYRFKTHFVSTTNNFGIVRVEPHPDGGHQVQFTVRAWQPRTRRLRTAGVLVSAPEG
jgi:phosphodiesterase/alkaline phosphatase D-like protein